jgi:AcrR family transcriptional regulator
MSRETPDETLTQSTEGLRSKVLAAAVDIIDKEGVGSLSMREVARRAGVSHQAPYHYFADRADILASIAEEGFTTLTERFHETLASDREPAQACLSAYVHVALQFPGHFRVMFRPELCPLELHPHAEAAANKAFEALFQLVRRVAPSDISADDALVWAVTLWSQAHGLATLLVDGPLRRKLPANMNIDHLIDSVGATSARRMGLLAK